MELPSTEMGKVAGRETYSRDQEFSSGHAGFEKS